MKESNKVRRHTFDSLFNSEFNISKIIIPMIQRDYAQGRDNKEIAKKREDFLNALYEAIDKKSPLVLDFIYGDIDKEGILTLLDGQQRLTTLFLLYWYGAKKEGIEKEEYQFLSKFSYETRPNSRDFCRSLIDIKVKQNDNRPLDVCNYIENDSTFLLEYKKDATIKSMLTMLKDIDDKFYKIPSLWERLINDKLISFYFLPIKDIGLTSEIYIKMNSRGKPLTSFENFKAKFIKDIDDICENDTKRAEDISFKIDTTWTNLLWQYRSEESNIIDEDFLRYFKFICNVICYEEGGTWEEEDSEEELRIKYFSATSKLSLNKRKAHLLTLEKYFDIWKSFSSPNELFNTLFSIEHTSGKVLIAEISSNKDLFNECIKNYGEWEWTLKKFIMFYAVLQYLFNKKSITGEDCFTRLRIVRNLLQNSDNELREENMSVILEEVRKIVIKGEIEKVKRGFNTYQIKEEKEKCEAIKSNPSISRSLYKLEEHPLLYGRIGVIGLKNITLCDRFYSLFECDKDKIDCALLIIHPDPPYWQEGNYATLGVQYQAGSALPSTWKTLFHTSNREELSKTQDALITLLEKKESFTDEYLTSIINEYIKQCKKDNFYRYIYYYVKYPAFRPSSHGLYRFENPDIGDYEITALTTKSYLSTNAYEPFLMTIKDELAKTSSYECSFIDYYGQELKVEEYKVKCVNSGFIIKEERKKEETFFIKQDNKIDKEDRIQKIVKYLKSILSSK